MGGFVFVDLISIEGEEFTFMIEANTNSARGEKLICERRHFKNNCTIFRKTEMVILVFDVMICKKDRWVERSSILI